MFDDRGPFTDSTPLTATKFNGVCRISGTGADLSASCIPSIHKFLFCTSTGSGFTADHMYRANAAGDAYVDEGTGSSGGGGSTVTNYVSNIAGNSKVITLQFLNQLEVKKAAWTESVSGTGAITDDTDGSSGELSIKLATGGTSGGRSAITQTSLMQDFSKRSFLQFKSRVGTLSSLNLRGGVNCDLVTSADSTTVQYSAEICTATNNNWWVRSATTEANTATNTSIAATTNRVGIKLEHYPDLGTPSVLMYIDANTAVTKTTNIPVTGTGSNNNVIRFSVKNSTASDRPWFIYGCRLVYTVSGSWV